MKWCILFFALLSISCAAVEFRVPLMKSAPKIDGVIDANEWAASVSFDGFIKMGDKKLEPRRARGYVAADETHLYVAIQSQLPDEGELLTKITRDTLNAVHDDSVEVYVCPNPDDVNHVEYQFLTNSTGKGGYNVILTGAAKEDAAWQGNYTQAHGIKDGWWTFECAIPIASFGAATKDKRTMDIVWGINLARDWKPDWGWTSISGGYANAPLKFAFTKDPAPGVNVKWSGQPGVQPFDATVELTNSSATPLELSAQLQLVRNNMPEVKDQRSITLAPASAGGIGGKESLKVAVPENDPTTLYDLNLKVSNADSKSTFHDRSTRFDKLKAPFKWVQGKPKDAAPVDFQFSYYPSKNKLRVLADVNGLPKDAKLTKASVIVRKKPEGTEVKSAFLPILDFKDGRQELTLDLPALNGEYDLAVKVETEGSAPKEAVKSFERQVFPWENLQAGLSDKVYPPFTPIKVEGKKVSVVLRDYMMNEAVLFEQINATSANTKITKPLLAAPMRYVARVNGEDATLTWNTFDFTENKQHQPKVFSLFSYMNLSGRATGVWDCDGTMRLNLLLLPSEGKPINSLTLEIPLREDIATMIHANSDRIRAPIADKLPQGNGVVWDSRKLACDDYIKNFCPYIYLGNGVRGLCWFAENDKGWGWDPKTPNVEVSRENGQVILRVHLINQPTVITEPRTISFGLLAAPVKPPVPIAGEGPNAWRYRYYKDKYRLLGTDINWLALGDCGSVYPAGQDMNIWSMLGKSTTQRLKDDDIESLIARDKKFYEPYGANAVKTFENHARSNLRAHFGGKMAFYYNRASCQLFPEFETFKDEWTLDDLRAVGKGNSRGEIKVVPSKSFIDYNLYWYAKSFELGQNQAVYWDNWFICPSYNTEMTDAYRKPDGTVIPASGIWGLRELCRRTFVMMNERGMRPLTFPHMTSFSALPMLSFAAMQYDWEWKYSEGDVQDRFTREYLQLVSTGELAGTWAVPLHDHEKLAEDPWTQRTFAAVRLVHELDGNGGWRPGTKPEAALKKVIEPVMNIVNRDSTVVYKYWEDRAQPVRSSDNDYPSIVYVDPGKETVAVIVSYAKQDGTVTVDCDMKTLGISETCKVTDTETGEALTLKDGKITFPLKKHDMKILRFVP